MGILLPTLQSQDTYEIGEDEASLGASPSAQLPNWNFDQLSSNGVMPHLPVGARKDWVGVGNRTHLEFGIGGKVLRSQDLMGPFFLLGKLLPLDISAEVQIRCLIYAVT